MQEHFEKVIGRLRTLEGLVERLQTVESLAGQVSPVKIVAVKYADFTGTQAVSLESGAGLNISGLEFAHAMVKSTNKILLLGQVGILANSVQYANSSIRFTVDGTAIVIGDAVGSRQRTSAWATVTTASTYAANSHFIMAGHTPGTVASRVYRLTAVNGSHTTRTVYVNRNESDDNAPYRSRGASVMALIEYEE